MKKKKTPSEPHSRPYQTREALAEFVLKEYERRQAERAGFERQWQLNMNFLLGNQYCGAGARGEIEDSPKRYGWESREVFNHLAPIVETRLSKLVRVRPKMAVLPASDEDSGFGAPPPALIRENKRGGYVVGGLRHGFL